MRCMKEDDGPCDRPPGRSRSCFAGHSSPPACLPPPRSAARRRRTEDRQGDLRRRLLLVRGGRFRQGAGRDLDHLGLYRRQDRRIRPTRQVSGGGTGHAEAVEIVYDPAQGDLRQAARRVLAQHRSAGEGQAVLRLAATCIARAIFYLDDEQKKLAEETKKTVAGEVRAAHGLHRDRQGRARSTRPRTITRITTRRTRPRYKFYRWNCGRDQRLEQLWGKKESVVMIDDARCCSARPERSRCFAAVALGLGDRRGARRQIRDREERRGVAPLLTPAQYDVLRKHGTERAGTSPLNTREAQGHVRLRGLRPAAVLVRHEIRERHRLAELLAAAAERGRHHDRQVVLHDAHRGALPPLRRPSRPCVRRRPEADRPALLHERRGAEVRARAASGPA